MLETGLVLSDGTVLSHISGILDASSGFDYGSVKSRSPYMGLVMKIYYPDDPLNLSKKWVEADVLCFVGKSWMPIPRAKITNKRGNFENFEECYPQPPTYNIKGGKLVLETLQDASEIMTKPEDMNCEWVIVDILNGNPKDAIVRSETLHHAMSLDSRAQTVDGDVRGFQHNGIRHYIDKNGDIEFETYESKDKTLVGKQGKNVSYNFQNEDGNGVKVEILTRKGNDIVFRVTATHTNGNVHKVEVAEEGISVGETAFEPMVKGDKYTTQLNQDQSEHNGHKHPYMDGITGSPMTQQVNNADQLSLRHKVGD